jgi:D-amino peptidase
MNRLVLAAALLLPFPAWAQARAPGDTMPRDTTPPAAYFGVTEYQLARQKLELDMQRGGFSVYIIADMEGLAAAVRNATEMKPVARGGSPQHERFRQELTDEVNALIAGARAAGATQFIVNEGHGGTLFRNVLVDQLDPEAILIRGYPKPIVMSTGLNPMVDAIMIVGAHANAGSPGVISHNFAFDSFTINDKVLNEAGIAAFIGGEMGVPLALASGDDVLTVKTAFSRSAAAVLPPATVHRLLRQASARAVRRVKAGELRPLTMEKPYRVRFCLRKSFTEDKWVTETVGRLKGVDLDARRGCFGYVSESAEAVGNLLNEIEWTVLKP